MIPPGFILLNQLFEPIDKLFLFLNNEILEDMSMTIDDLLEKSTLLIDKMSPVTLMWMSLLIISTITVLYIVIRNQNFRSNNVMLGEISATTCIYDQITIDSFFNFRAMDTSCELCDQFCHLQEQL